MNNELIKAMDNYLTIYAYANGHVDFGYAWTSKSNEIVRTGSKGNFAYGYLTEHDFKVLVKYHVLYHDLVEDTGCFNQRVQLYEIYNLTEDQLKVFSEICEAVTENTYDWVKKDDEVTKLDYLIAYKEAGLIKDLNKRSYTITKRGRNIFFIYGTQQIALNMSLF